MSDFQFMVAKIDTSIHLVNRQNCSRLRDNAKPQRTTENNMTIGQRVRHARILRKMTQKQLAQRVGIKQSSISTLETAKNPRTRYLVKIAIVLRVRAEWLESGTGEMEWSEGLGDAVASINQAMQGMSPRSLDLLLRYVAALSDEDDPT